MTFAAPKGTRDLLPGETNRWQYLERVFMAVCHRFSYREIRLPTFEQTELFQRGVGDQTDVVQKEMYTFTDKGGRSMTLRPEGTAGVARSFIENGLASWPAPVRLFYNITAFRYENVQKGRYREFHQFGCEAIGSEGPAVDAELISLLQAFFQELGLQKTKLLINSIGCPVCRGPYLEALKTWLRPRVDQLCTHCQARFERNPLRILDCKEAGCQQATRQAPTQLDALCPDCQHHFDAVRELLTELDLPYQLAPRMVRGLDYYTRTVFEFVSEHVGSQGTICGGGRYDGLLETLGGPAMPGIGFALGVERLLLELDAQQQQLPEQAPVDLFIAVAGEHMGLAMKLCQHLRRAGYRIETDLMNRSLRAQMKYAGRNKVRQVLVLGDDEAQSGNGRIRDLQTGQETEVALSRIADVLSNREENR